MKKLLVFSVVTLTVLVGASFATSLDDAINIADQEIEKITLETTEDLELEEAVVLLHEDEITKYDTVDDFMPYQNIRRDEAAKMYVNFQKNTLGINDLIAGKMCYFTDTHLGHSDLVDIMSEACLRGLFNGHAGTFMPTESISNAQAVIVLVRMVDGIKVEPTDDHYAVNYMHSAEDMGLLDGLSISSRSSWDSPASRATIAKLLFRAVDKK